MTGLQQYTEGSPNTSHVIVSLQLTDVDCQVNEPGGTIAPPMARLESGELYNADTGEIVAGAPLPAAPGKGPAKRMVSVVSASDFAGQPAPPQLWHVPGLIPHRTVTLFSGDGGTGKSLLALQLAVATTAGREWLGRDVQPGCCLYVSAEDDLGELHRRVERITRTQGIDLAQLDQLKIVPLAGEDAVLASPDQRGNIIASTPLFACLVKLVQEHRPRLVVLDTSADFFAGSEIDRTQVRQFIGLLRGLAIRSETAVLLLSHPSLTGMSSGSGLSGSTAWNNSVRSRLYLSRILTKEGSNTTELDTDRRTLATMKANYAASGGALSLRWNEGVFVLDEAASISTLSAAGQHARIDAIFLDLLAQYLGEGRSVNVAPSANYAPLVFSLDARANGITKRAFVAAMNRLLGAQRIRVNSEGPPSKRTQKLALPDNARGEDNADAA